MSRPDRPDRARVRRLAAALLAVVAVALPPASPIRATRGPAPASSEVRALWVLRTSLTTPDRIRSVVAAARENGFNTLLVQVRGRGDSYFRGGVEPLAAELARQPESFDPLATAVEASHAAGLRVHAWVNVNLVSSAVDLPTSREHIVNRRPGWLMVPRDLAQELAAIDADSPGYVGKLARWTRAQSAEIEGLYASPVLPEAAAHLEAVVRRLASRYAVDGVHFDYARYPNDRFDYSRAALAEFRTYVRPRIAEAVARNLDDEGKDDLLAYPDALPQEWREFRTARMTALMKRLGAAVRAARTDAIVTAATAPDLREAAVHRLQDWRTWLADGLIDAVCPMAYTPEPERFAEQIAAAREAAAGRLLWAGIGAYRLSPAQTIENIHTARRLGADGIVLFSYDSLTDPRQSAADYLALVGRGAFADALPNAGSR